MSDDVNINAYFERIGFAGSIAPSLPTLQALQWAHVTAIPFENLTPLLGLPVRLDLKSLEQKLIHERRGGYCFEQNTLFMRALTTLGFTVTAHAARVLLGRPEGTTPSRGHMILMVEIGGQSYLADVGFGGMTPTAPLRLRPGVEQETPHELYRINGDDDAGYVLESKIGEEWRALYSFDLVVQHDIDFEVFNWHVATHPDSFFVNNLTVAKSEKGRRLGLVNNAFSIHPTGEPSEKRVLTSVAEIKEILTGTFGINLPPAEKLDPVLERIAAAPGAP